MSTRKTLTIACQHHCGEVLTNADENAIRYTCGLCLLGDEAPPAMELSSDGESVFNVAFRDIGSLTEAMLPEEFDAAARTAATLNVSRVLLTTPQGTRVWVEAPQMPSLRRERSYTIRHPEP